MEDLPIDYTDHNLPLVLLSGLDDGEHVGTGGHGVPRQESGTKLVIQSPACEGERARHLLQQFINRDGSISAWNAGSLPGPVGSMKYRMQAIGRVSLIQKPVDGSSYRLMAKDLHSTTSQSSTTRTSGIC